MVRRSTPPKQNFVIPIIAICISGISLIIGPILGAIIGAVGTYVTMQNKTVIMETNQANTAELMKSEFKKINDALGEMQKTLNVASSQQATQSHDIADIKQWKDITQAVINDHEKRITRMEPKNK